ncbi:MAG: NADH:ubiquinone oxidoreductase, Na [Planctomycetota bacterium]|nr:MAG: NADH:ubiquinone oxidoreductase, Na [Planctomycetota bacterium]
MKTLICFLIYFHLFTISANENIAEKITFGAKNQIGKTLYYDPSYVKIKYPNGDLPIDRGVCTDVVIRALRNASIDLQKLVHEDMRVNFKKYPNNWGLKKTDKNIDHRRVPNLMTYFKRKGWSKKVKKNISSFKSGDIIAWRLSNGRLHIGIIAHKQKGQNPYPYVIHNIGNGVKLENQLFSFKIIGHYRVK